MVDEFPKVVKARDVAGGAFAPGQFMLQGGRAKYDQVWICDGGEALYLVRVNNDLSVVRRWIEWDTEILQMFNPEDDKKDIVFYDEVVVKNLSNTDLESIKNAVANYPNPNIVLLTSSPPCQRFSNERKGQK